MKQEYHNRIDDLLVKAMLDDATVAEQIEINQWLFEDDEHQRYYEHFEVIWTESKRLEKQHYVDENAAWDRFKQRVEAPPVEVLPIYPKPAFHVMRIAAAVCLTFAAMWVAYLFFADREGVEQLSIAAGNQTLTDTLPDGSVVTLNKKAMLTYPARFEGTNREVTLTGEGFFDVAPDQSKPFIIHVNDLKVRVVGTSFNIKDSGEKTEVIVETGIVEVVRDKEKISLRPQEKALVLKSTDAFVKQKSEEEFYKHYRTGKLVCNGTPLWRLVEILNEIYGSNIIIKNEELRDRPINTTFENSSAGQIIQIVSETLLFDTETQGNQIILK